MSEVKVLQNDNLLDLLLEFQRIPKHKTYRTFMEISGYPHYENVCSNILKFYLNPQNEHGLHDLVLKSLVHILDKKFQVDYEFEQITVDREVITKKGNRLDLLIQTSNYVIGIENKVFHHLHNDLYDYGEMIDSYCSGSKKVGIKIILSLYKYDDIKISHSDFQNIIYTELFDNIRLYIGNYITPNNAMYITYLLDFIKSIENLTSKAMYDKRLLQFFQKNSELVQDLTKGYIEFKAYLLSRLETLKTLLPEEVTSHANQWVWKEDDYPCLVHDYDIEGFKIAIDAYITPQGWIIKLFARNQQSALYLFNKMINSNELLLNAYLNEDNVIIYERLNFDVEINDVSICLQELLLKIENYIQSINSNA